MIEPMQLVQLQENIANTLKLHLFDCSCGLSFFTLYAAAIHIQQIHPDDQFEDRIQFRKNPVTDLNLWDAFYTLLASKMQLHMGSVNSVATFNLSPPITPGSIGSWIEQNEKIKVEVVLPSKDVSDRAVNDSRKRKKPREEEIAIGKNETMEKRKKREDLNEPVGQKGDCHLHKAAESVLDGAREEVEQFIVNSFYQHIMESWRDDKNKPHAPQEDNQSTESEQAYPESVRSTELSPVTGVSSPQLQPVVIIKSEMIEPDSGPMESALSVDTSVATINPTNEDHQSSIVSEKSSKTVQDDLQTLPIIVKAEPLDPESEPVEPDASLNTPDTSRNRVTVEEQHVLVPKLEPLELSESRLIIVESDSEPSSPTTEDYPKLAKFHKLGGSEPKSNPANPVAATEEPRINTDGRWIRVSATEEATPIIDKSNPPDVLKSSSNRDSGSGVLYDPRIIRRTKLVDPRLKKYANLPVIREIPTKIEKGRSEDQPLTEVKLEMPASDGEDSTTQPMDISTSPANSDISLIPVPPEVPSDPGDESRPNPSEMRKSKEVTEAIWCSQRLRQWKKRGILLGSSLPGPSDAPLTASDVLMMTPYLPVPIPKPQYFHYPDFSIRHARKDLFDPVTLEPTDLQLKLWAKFVEYAVVNRMSPMVARDAWILNDVRAVDLKNRNARGAVFRGGRM